MSMRVLDFSDGFESASAPTEGNLAANSLPQYASTAAFVTAKGSSAADGDCFYHTADDVAMLYQNGGWVALRSASLAAYAKDAAFKLPSYVDDAAYVTGKGSAAAAGDVYSNSTDNSIHIYSGAAWRAMATLTGTETLTNKTLTSPKVRHGVTTTKTTTYSIASGDGVVPMDVSGGSFTVSLPDANSVIGEIFTVTIAVAPAGNQGTLGVTTGGDLIDGMASLKMGTLNDSITVQSVGGGKYKILSYNVCNAVLSESNTARSITNGAFNTGEFLMEDEIYDPLAQYNNATAIFTVQVPGKYRVGASIEYGVEAGWGRNEGVYLGLYKNGTITRTLSQIYANVTDTLILALAGQATVSCAAGDTLEVRARQDSGGAINTTTDNTSNWVSYERIGN